MQRVNYFHDFIKKYGTEKERSELTELINERGLYKKQAKKKQLAAKYKHDLYINKCYGPSIGVQYISYYDPEDTNEYGIHQIHTRPLQNTPLFLDFANLHDENQALLFTSRLLASSRIPLQYCGVSRNPNLNIGINNAYYRYLDNLINGIFNHTNLYSRPKIILRGSGIGIYETLYVLRAIIKKYAIEKKALPPIVIKLNNTKELINISMANNSSQQTTPGTTNHQQAIKKISKEIKKTLEDHYSISDSKKGKIETEIISSDDSSEERKLIDSLKNFSYVYSSEKKNIPGSIPQEYDIVDHLRYSAHEAPDYRMLDKLEIQNSKQWQTCRQNKQ